MVRKRQFVDLVPFMVVGTMWFYFAILRPIPFWQLSDDYPWYSLSHAFTLLSKLSGFSATNHGYDIHPGVPFGIASWLSLRLATIWTTDPVKIITYSIDHADRFWMWAKFTALVLNFAGLLMIRTMFKETSNRFLMGSALYFAAVPAVFGASLLQLTNESFALLYITSFYLLAFKLLTPPKNGQSPPVLAWTSRCDVLSVCLGGLAAIGWSIKIYYLAPAIGLAFGFVVAASLGILKAKAVFRGAVFFGLSFLLVSVLIVFVVGGTSFLGWISWNWGMLSHEGRYGTGSEGFIRLQSVIDALTTILESTNGTFLLIIGFLSTFCLAIAIARTRAASWQRTDVPFLVTLFGGASISFVALIKHYAPHYALPLCATLPCVLLLIRADEFGRLMKVGIPLVSAAFLLNFYTYTEIYLAEEHGASVLSRDVSAIEALPISAGEKRVWGYYIPAKASIARMIDQYAGSAFVHEVLNKSLSATDIVPNNEPAATNWKYVIFPKKYFPTRESIAANYPKQFDFAATRFALRETDSISELATCFLLSRSP